MKREPKIIDAEFEVVQEAPGEDIPPGGRIGFSYFSLPAEWREWGWVGRITYVVLYGLMLWGIFLVHRWLMANLPLPDHW